MRISLYTLWISLIYERSQDHLQNYSLVSLVQPRHHRLKITLFKYRRMIWEKLVLKTLRF